MHLQIDLTPSLIVSRLTNFTLRAAQPPGSFFTVPEHVLVDNYTVYKSLRLVKPNKSSSLDPVPGTVWKGSLLNFHLLSWTSTTRRCCKVMCPNPSNSRMLSRCQKALCQNPWSRIYVKFRLRRTLRRSWRALHCLRFRIKSAVHAFDVYQFALAGKLTTHALVYFLDALLQSLD